MVRRIHAAFRSRGHRSQPLGCRPLILFLPAACLALALAGCEKGPPQVAAAETPVAPVSHPVERQVTDYVDFTGRTDAVNSVNIIARVTGYITRMPFKEGSEVKAGDLLFEIDPRPYQAQLDQAKSQVTLYQAQLDLAKTTLARYQALYKSTPGAVSQQELDQYKASVQEAESRVSAQLKSLEVYNLNKEFTRVVSPIDGQVSRYYLTLGNLVNQDQTLLTTVVSLDPMYAYFDMDEPTLLRIRRAYAEGTIKAPGDDQGDEGDLIVYMGLQGEEGFPHKGIINFVNNRVNSTTGSVTVRGVFPNPHVKKGKSAAPKGKSAATDKPAAATGKQAAPEKAAASATAQKPGQRRRRAVTVASATMPGWGARLLSPGMFVRIRLPISEPHQALLIIDRAIQSDQQYKYVYVVNSENKVEYRRITAGALQPDGLRVVTGVKPDEWVVVGGLQRVRPRMEVQPEPGAMPSLVSQSDADEAGADNAATKAPKKSKK